MKRHSKTFLLAIATSLLLLSCTDGGPEETFELMRQEACNGNVEGFFSYVDKDEVAKNYTKRFMDQAMEAYTEDINIIQKTFIIIVLKLNEYGINILGEEYDISYKDQLDFLDLLVWDPIATTIQEGPGNSFCDMQYESIGNDEIQIAGSDGSMGFGKTRDGWKIVSVDLGNTQDSDTSSTSDAKEFKDNQDFRNARWGMSPSEVIVSDPNKLGAEKDQHDDKFNKILIYRGTLWGMKCTYVYRFIDDKFANGTYLVEEEHNHKDVNLEVYKKFKSNLIEQFGQPVYDETVWEDYTYKDNPAKALRIGHLSYAAEWQTPTTLIFLSLAESDKNLTIGLTYTDIERDSQVFDSDKKTADSKTSDKKVDNKAKKDENYDFRKTHWGMSKNEVKSIETVEFVGETDDAIRYEEEIGGLDAALMYMFEDGKLKTSGYLFENEYSDTQDYKRDYEKLQKAFTQKYGEPHSEDIKWEDDTYKNNPSQHIKALENGHVSYYTQWNTPSTNIMLGLYKSKDDQEITLITRYKALKITNKNTETLEIGTDEIEEKL